MSEVGNEDVADVLERVADLLQAQEGNPFRIRAYRGGAQTLRELDRPVREILDAGMEALSELPGI